MTQTHQCICSECGATFKARAKSAGAEIKLAFNEEDVRLTDLLHDLVSRNYPFVTTKPPKDKDYEEMNRIARIDGKPYVIIEKVIEWCQDDEFWKQNIRSVSKLRKQFDNLLIKAKAEHDQRKARVVAV
jgi:hypothetical protein